MSAHLEPRETQPRPPGEATEAKVTPKRQKRAKPAPKSPYLPEQDDENVRQYVLMYGTDSVWDTVNNFAMKLTALRNAILPERYKAWQMHPKRRWVLPDQIVFDPTETCGPDFINMFNGLPLAPINGDCADLLALLVHLVSESADTDKGVTEVLNFVLDWLAYPLQHPGAKLSTAVVVHGPQGTGKNLFFEAYARIFGVYAAVLGQMQLESRYNDWASRKLFLIGNEIVASNELAHHKNLLKSLVTEGTIQIEAKFQAVRIEKNHCNFVFLSNDARPLALERDDRRHLVIYCPPKLEAAFYTRVHASLSHGAVEALYALLLQRDLGDFHAHTPPPITRAKAELIDLGLRPAERFAREWLDGAIDLPVWVCSTNQLYRAFGRWCRMNGERFPANQANFSSSLSKFARDRLSRKTASPSPTEAGSSLVLWLPAGTGPLDGVRWFDFAREAVAAFEGPLSRFGTTTEGSQ